MTQPYYQDDLVTLYHGDCREIREWLDADVLVTDPPYGIGVARFKKVGRHPLGITGEIESGRGSSNRVLTAEHVQVRDDALALWVDRPGIIFGHWRAPRPANTRLRLIWDKEIRQGAGGIGPWRPGDEEIYVVGAWPNARRLKRGPVVSTVLRHPALRGKDRPDHPTPKPVALMLDLVRHCPAGVLADPFAGAGATLLAARQLGRPVIGVEIEERYCALTAERLAQDALPFGEVAS